MHCYAPHLKHTHTDLMHAEHSVVHSSVQTTISKMLISFKIIQIALRRKYSNNARDGKMNFEATWLAVSSATEKVSLLQH